MERKYSGSPGEGFYTGGGLQSFTNFERWEGERIMTVRVGFQHSVNLVFIRMMRDIVRYELFHGNVDMSDIFEDRNSPERRVYLERFADQEGSAYMTGFYQRYRGKDADQRLATLPSPRAREHAALYGAHVGDAAQRSPGPRRG